LISTAIGWVRSGYDPSDHYYGYTYSATVAGTYPSMYISFTDPQSFPKNEGGSYPTSYLVDVRGFGKFQKIDGTCYTAPVTQAYVANERCTTTDCGFPAGSTLLADNTCSGPPATPFVCPSADPGAYWPFPVGSHLSQSEVPSAPPEGCTVPDCTLMEQVMTNGSCGAKSCPEGLELNPDGTCSGSCPSYQELFEGKCVDRCDAGFQRDLQGHCTASCPPGKEIVLGVCQDKCPSDQTRNTDGTCPDPCANKRQDAANKCSTGYVMAADCSYTCDSCSAALSSCITRCATLGGIMTNTCSQSYGSDCQCKNDLISSDPNLKQGTTTDIKTVTNSDGSKTTTETVDVTSPDGTHTKTVTTKDYDSSGNEIGSNKVVTESKGSGSDSDSNPDNNHLPPYSSGGDGLDFNEWSGIGSAVSRTLPVQYITGILEYISAFNVSGSAPIFSIPMGSYGDLNCDLSIFNPVVSVFRSLIAIFFNVGMILVTIKLWSRWG